MSGKQRIWNWVRRLIRYVVCVACVVWLLRTADRFALVLPLLWTAVWINVLIGASRKVRRDVDLAGKSLQPKREMPRPVFVTVATVAFFLMFGWALVVGLAWGPIAGIASLFLELITAKATLRVTEFFIDYNEIMADFTPPRDDGAGSRGRTKRSWAFAIRPLPRNVQVIALSVLAVVLWTIIIKYTPWLPWLDVGAIVALLIVPRLARAFKAGRG